MEKGYIANNGEVVCWIPEGETRGLARWSAGPKGVKLAKFSFFDGSEAIAHYCRDCGKILIDINENKVK